MLHKNPSLSGSYSTLLCVVRWLEKWVNRTFIVFSKWEGKILFLGRSNDMHQNNLGHNS